MPSYLERVRAGRAIVDTKLNPAQRNALATALGVELFGDGKLGRLVVCRVCGTIGDPGDDCGRADGHRLTP